MSEKRLCGIPAKTLPPCDLEWGHAGEMHANGGDGFYARQHAEEHRKRQAETGNLPKPVFHFSISADVSLDLDQIWPDKDGPANPTVEDVLEVIKNCGGFREILTDWDLDHDLTMTVTGPGKEGRDVTKDVP